VAIELVSWGAAAALPATVWGLLAAAIAGAAAGAIAISALCSMTVQRAAIAAEVFLGYKIVLALLCLGLLGAGE
jgi:hypothetical protein